MVYKNVKVYTDGENIVKTVRRDGVKLFCQVLARSIMAMCMEFRIVMVVAWIPRNIYVENELDKYCKTLSQQVSSSSVPEWFDKRATRIILVHIP